MMSPSSVRHNQSSCTHDKGNGKGLPRSARLTTVASMLWCERKSS